MYLKTGLLLIVASMSWFTSDSAEAAVFKCVGADGEVSYNQTPCIGEEKTEKVLNTASASKTTYDCRIANNFARKTAMAMRAGQTSGGTFASYGGIDAVPSTAIGVINYVYTHKNNADTVPQRIAALSAARCSAGSYGPVGCDDFPYGFISELGGCEAATQSTIGIGTKPAAEAAQTTDVSQNGSTQTLGARTAADTGLNSADCKSDVQAQLTELFAQMRSGQSASRQGELQKKKNDLSTQLSSC